MTFDELMAMYTAAGGGQNAVVSTGEGGGTTGGDYRTVNVPGVGWVTIDANGQLVSTNRFEAGGVNGSGGIFGVQAAPGQTATDYRRDADPAYDSAAATRRGLGLVAAVIGGGYGLSSLGVGGAGAAGMGGLDAASLAAIDGVSPTQLAALTNPAGSGGLGSGFAAGAEGIMGAGAAAPEAGGMFSSAIGSGGTGGFQTAGGALSGGTAAGPLGGSVFGAPAAATTLGTGGGLLGPAAGGAAGTAASLFSNPNLIGAGVGALAGALGSGDRTQTQQTLMDPSARAYLDSFRSRAEQVASQPYQAPTFALTQGPTEAQTQGQAALQAAMGSPMTGQVNDLASQFMGGARDGTAAGNAEMGAVRDLVGQGTAAGTAARNEYFGPNSFLDPMIAAAQGDLSRSYANTVAPKFASGSSFGNSGLGFAEVDSRNDLMRNLGRIGTDMRFADYNMQANLGEQYAGRQDAMTNNNRSFALQGANTLGQLGESAAGRADSMFTGNQNRALQAGQLGQAGVRDQANMANALFGQGSTIWNQGQQNIDNQWGAYTNQQDFARNQLSAMNPGLGVGMNAGSSSTTPGNPWAGALGGGVLGSQFGNWMSGGGSRTPTSIFG
jgi:hypothetical protein